MEIAGVFDLFEVFIVEEHSQTECTERGLVGGSDFTIHHEPLAVVRFAKVTLDYFVGALAGN